MTVDDEDIVEQVAEAIRRTRMARVSAAASRETAAADRAYARAAYDAICQEGSMSREELLRRLRGFKGSDPEAEHSEADDLLLVYIDDAEVAEAFNALKKWYA